MKIVTSTGPKKDIVNSEEIRKVGNKRHMVIDRGNGKMIRIKSENIGDTLREHCRFQYFMR